MGQPLISGQRMASALTVLMVVQALLGLLLPEAYRDVAWIKATWYGNDWITLVAAVPLLGVGNSIQRGDKLFEVTQPGPLRIRFELSQSVGRSVGIGTLVEIFNSSNGRALGAARVHTASDVDPGRDARTYFADVIEGAGLTAGTALTIRLPDGAGEANTTIPRAVFASDSKLIEGESATIHVVLADGTCRPRTVRVDAVVDDRVLVSSGIAPGDRIVLAPPSQLRPGVSIDVLSETTDY